MLFRAFFAPAARRSQAPSRSEKLAEISTDSTQNWSQNHAIPAKKYYIERARISAVGGIPKNGSFGLGRAAK
jgi:hypothetical protein